SSPIPETDAFRRKPERKAFSFHRLRQAAAAHADEAGQRPHGMVCALPCKRFPRKKRRSPNRFGDDSRLKE
ncbi:hypothetical protein, partial [Pelomicrobium sp. G1]|uniref:hypothetical protein n=1 Tax=Pelomicrobium sp. G1 TaxID=3452920 RepID=UPI003F759043